MPRRNDGERELDEAFDHLQRELPSFLAGTMRWLRRPASRLIRLPLGILLIVLSFFWFLPVIGIELLPIGLLLISFDIPFLRRPMARAVLWLLRKWVSWRKWWRGR